MMERLYGSPAARRLTEAYEGRGNGHHVGYFQNITGWWTVFEAENDHVVLVDSYHDEAIAISAMEKIVSLFEEEEKNNELT